VRVLLGEEVYTFPKHGVSLFLESSSASVSFLGDRTTELRVLLRFEGNYMSTRHFLIMLVSLGPRYQKYSCKVKSLLALWVRECILDHVDSLEKNVLLPITCNYSGF
jgi:hypothetical protein